MIDLFGRIEKEFLEKVSLMEKARIFDRKGRKGVFFRMRGLREQRYSGREKILI